MTSDPPAPKMASADATPCPHCGIELREGQLLHMLVCGIKPCPFCGEERNLPVLETCQTSCGRCGAVAPNLLMVDALEREIGHDPKAAPLYCWATRHGEAAAAARARTDVFDEILTELECAYVSQNDGREWGIYEAIKLIRSRAGGEGRG